MRLGECDARAIRPIGCVGHHVDVEQREERDARIFASIAARRAAQFVRLARFEREAGARVERRGFGSGHLDDFDARDVALRYRARIDEQLPVTRARDGWIQNALRFRRRSVRFEHDAQTRHARIERGNGVGFHFHPCLGSYRRTVDARLAPPGVTTSMLEPTR